MIRRAMKSHFCANFKSVRIELGSSRVTVYVQWTLVSAMIRREIDVRAGDGRICDRMGGSRAGLNPERSGRAHASQVQVRRKERYVLKALDCLRAWQFGCRNVGTGQCIRGRSLTHLSASSVPSRCTELELAVLLGLGV